MEEIQRKENQKKRKNIKLFPIYKLLSWDLLFFYAIIFLYLIQVKNLTASQILLAEAMYNIAIIISLFPSGKIVDKIGKKNSVILANICVSISILIIILMNNFYHLIISYAVMAFGYSIKGIAENIILYDSLPSGKRRGKLFSIIDGKSSSYFYYIDAISAITTGFLYTINPYTPLVLCLIMCVISTILSLKFKHTNTMDKKQNTNNEKVPLKDAIKYVKRSKRIKYLILFYATFSGLLYVLSSLRSSVFEDLNLQAQYFGIVYAFLQIVAGTSARFQDKVHNKFKNETLAVLAIPLTMACIFIGLLGRLEANDLTFSIIIILFIIQGIIKGPYRTLIVRYMTNFTNRNIRPKLATIQNFVYYSVNVVFTLLCSWLLEITSTADTFVIVGVIATFLIGSLLYFMKGRVGLKPDEYPQEDLQYSHFNKEKTESKEDRLN